MTLLISRRDLQERQAIVPVHFATLVAGLRHELSPLIERTPEVPREKALLSRTGGRCSVDGAALVFDPFDERHLCPRCGREYAGAEHDSFRLYWYQLWLAERAVHAALLGVVTHDEASRGLAIQLLEQYAEQYLAYPNRDNVLGPSRPFFSTYLESIWLLQISIAMDLLELGAPTGAVAALGGRIRDRLIAPSVAIIASYDEGMSNRQVWNNAALLAGASLLDDDALRTRAMAGGSGVNAHLRHALLADGSWYEGENYHFFAHRGLWYAIQMADTAGEHIDPVLLSRFREGFATPFRTVLPDLTYPSRRDSQYAVSVRQPRFAESCELGLAQGDDTRLAGMLARLYAQDISRGDTGRWSSSADVERNLSATSLTRADLSWRGLLFARAELPPLARTALTSDLLPDQGFGILRREGGTVYAALDYGQSGGGHGHPDRLNILLSDGAQRWFDDPGTGSYVDDSLHWYRSTLAHCAPIVNGRSQERVHGWLDAFEDHGNFGWMSASAPLGDSLLVQRTLVVAEDYLIDELEWTGVDDDEIALPLHGVDVVDASGNAARRVAERIMGGEAEEDGFSYLAATTHIQAGAGAVRLRSEHSSSQGHELQGWAFVPRRARWYGARAPRAPSLPGTDQLILVRAAARAATFTMIWSWRNKVERVERGSSGAATIWRTDGASHIHARDNEGWLVVVRTSEGERRIRLAGRERTALDAGGHDAGKQSPEVRRARSLPDYRSLGAADYRRSEQSWDEADRPTATLALSRTRAGVRVDVRVPKSARAFIDVAALNSLDNEPAAINGDSVQFYAIAGNQSGGWLLVPDALTGSVQRRVISQWGGDLAVHATWRTSADGYELSAEIAVPRGVREVELGVIVNETVAGRRRRRGQLVLGGAAGEFVYLRGDRHDPSRLVRYSIA